METEDANSVEAPLTDTLAGGQLYLRLPSQDRILFNPIQTLYFHILVSDQFQTDTFFALQGCPLTRVSTVQALAA